jgi:hypothetical protein
MTFPQRGDYAHFTWIDWFLTGLVVGGFVVWLTR